MAKLVVLLRLCSVVLALRCLTFQFAGAARAFFVFGDSLVDNGNNNYLLSTARANTPPYGIDYPTHRPTGRFSNGLNIPDFISKRLGSESTLPYLSPELQGQKLLVGANFASAGIGILNDTGFQFVHVIRMFRQLDLFEEYQLRVRKLIGIERTQTLVAQSFVLITVGGNDFVNNYFLVPNSPRSRQFSIPEYVPYLISEYKKLLMRLYDLGVRQVLVTGTGPLGCVPAELALRSRNGECSAELQLASELYNPQLRQMLNELNSGYDADIFIYADFQLRSDPGSHGFVSTKVACCGQGPYNGLGLCTPASNLCANRDQYLFWDPFHPSEKTSELLVEQFMTASADYIFPMNLSTAMAIDPVSHP
ncbi:hypothetical protein MLD38_038715 [Melastoma candidum]|uniref:Uncharacterized protein n=1 Tax=Melastoma candidum TaxID=119954 RepID=A0ACB9L0M2_9MYRT|nr:hypothetical protein MLD38_038715 [Melastoma candidum]